MNRIFLSFTFVIIFSSACFTFIFAAPSKAPVVICLTGTCSSGKSTLIQSLTLLRDDIEIVDEDTLVHEAYPRAIAQKFPLEYACITQAVDKENIYHSLRTKDVLFKKTTTQKERLNAAQAIRDIQKELNLSRNLHWKQEVSQNISKEVLHKIQLALEKKKNVILDAWYVKGDHVQAQFPETPISRVLLYCSLPTAFQRLLKRNDEAIAQGNLKEKRFIGQLAGSFCSLYQINKQPLQPPIQYIDRQALDQTFSAMLQMLPDKDSPKSIFTLKELSQSQLQSIKTHFMQPFEEGSSETFYICPKEKQDLIIDNTSLDVQKAVRSIEEIIGNEREVKIQF